jgi:3-oxoacyl-[acyl-carrier-protein] synthase II
MTGHLLGAAGAVEAIITVLAIRMNCVPPTINTKQIEGAYGERYQFPQGTALEKELEYGMSNSFGFGGHIAILILRKWKQ